MSDGIKVILTGAALVAVGTVADVFAGRGGAAIFIGAALIVWEVLR